MKLVLAVSFMFLMSVAGCTKSEVQVKLCDAGKLASTIVAAQITMELSCKNLDAIKADLEKQLVQANICQKSDDAKATIMRAGLGDVLCTPFIEGMFTGVLTQIPSSWECTGGKLAADAKEKLIAACAKAF